MIGGRYELLKMLGHGGMGAVYQALDHEFGREVALKVIRPELADNPAVLKRFKQELVLARQISHPNVIQIHDLGAADSGWFISMELVSGRDLGKIIRDRGKLPPAEAVAIVVKVCHGLGAAHAANVIHRDLKPSNIMIQDDGKVLVMDFGLARSSDVSSGFTRSGAVLGTPDYMSPEQARGDSADHRSDIFSLGIILYELLTGVVPFKADTLMGTLLKRCQEQATPPAHVDPAIPTRLSDIVVKAMATAPAGRYQSVGEMVGDLENWQAGRTDAAAPPPTRNASRAWTWTSIGAAAVLLAAAGVSYWSSHKTAAPSSPHKPLSLLIADFDNRTADPIFDGTLEPAVSIGLEGASFISAYDRDAAHKAAPQLQPGATRLTPEVARLVAVREGIGAVVTGSVARDGAQYRLSLKVVKPLTGQEVATEESPRIGKDEVLAAVAKLVVPIRKQLGDASQEKTQQASSETFTSSSLEAAHSYALAQERQWQGKLDEEVKLYLEAIEKDPNFGRAYAGLAALQSNIGHRAEAEKYYQAAMARMSSMTDREKFRTRGGYYLMKRDDDKAVEEFSNLVKEYPGDLVGAANLALVYLYKRDLPHALEEGRHASENSPANVIWRDNLALYMMYAGDFSSGEKEAQKVLQLNPSFPRAFAAMALCELALGQPENAAQTWNRLAGVSKRGSSWSAQGLADLALYQARVADAASILENGIVADDANGDQDFAARKRVELAALRLDEGKPQEALLLASRAAASKDAPVKYMAASVFARCHQPDKARPLIRELGSALEPETRSYSLFAEGELALENHNASSAIEFFQQAQKLTDSWLGHLLLGRADLEAGAFQDAETQFDICLKRRGEAASMFIDEEIPTFRYLPPVYYYKGRAEEALKKPAASESYRAYLALRNKAETDSLAADAQRRLAALSH